MLNWTSRLALAGQLLALKARLGTETRPCRMVEIQFGVPGEGAWIEWDEDQRLDGLKPALGSTIGPAGVTSARR